MIEPGRVEGGGHRFRQPCGLENIIRERLLWLLSNCSISVDEWSWSLVDPNKLDASSRSAEHISIVLILYLQTNDHALPNPIAYAYSPHRYPFPITAASLEHLCGFFFPYQTTGLNDDALTEHTKQVIATESEARIHGAREAALAAETVLEARQEEARELRKNHEKAVAELKAEMAEKKRRGKDGVASRLEVRSMNKAPLVVS